MISYQILLSKPHALKLHTLGGKNPLCYANATSTFCTSFIYRQSCIHSDLARVLYTISASSQPFEQIFFFFTYYWGAYWTKRLKINCNSVRKFLLLQYPGAAVSGYPGHQWPGKGGVSNILMLSWCGLTETLCDTIVLQHSPTQAGSQRSLASSCSADADWLRHFELRRHAIAALSPRHAGSRRST